MRLIVAATPALALPVVTRLAEIHDILAVLTRPPAPQGRSSRLVPSSVETWAREAGIEVWSPQRLGAGDVEDRLLALHADLCPVVAYGALIPQSWLAISRFGWVNLHFSLLPRYRGAAPVQRALIDGCTTTGLSIFRLVAALDAGPIFLQKSVEVGPQEVAGDLLERLSLMGAEAMLEALAMVEQGAQPLEQDETGVSLAPKLAPEDARLTLTAPAGKVVDRIRAMSPEPGAWAGVGTDRLKILRASLRPDCLVAGEIGSLWATKRALLCRTGDHWIELEQVQASGKRVMAGPDWARGVDLAGVRLE